MKRRKFFSILIQLLIILIISYRYKLYIYLHIYIHHMLLSICSFNYLVAVSYNKINKYLLIHVKSADEWKFREIVTKKHKNQEPILPEQNSQITCSDLHLKSKTSTLLEFYPKARASNLTTYFTEKTSLYFNFFWNFCLHFPPNFFTLGFAHSQQ